MAVRFAKYERDKAKRSYKIPPKLTTAAFNQGESSGGGQILKTSELFLCSTRKRGRVGVQIACIPL